MVMSKFQSLPQACTTSSMHAEQQVHDSFGFALKLQFSAGPFEDAPINLAYSMDFACPELCRIKSAQAPRSGCLSALAHDIWGLGYLIFWLLTGCSYFQESTWEGMCQRHDEWVSPKQTSSACRSMQCMPRMVR